MISWSRIGALSVALIALVISAEIRAKELPVTVSAGERTREEVPVSVEVPIPAGAAMVTVRSDAGSQRGQIEPIGSGRGRIWWILSRLEAGKSRSYTIRLEERGERQLESQPVFLWKDSSGSHGKSMDLAVGSRPVLRYLYTPFDAQNVELTKKPFHHVFDPDGSRLITKGPGGLYPHHRGIYFGYNRCRVDGQVYDTWHAQRGEHQVHREVLRTFSGPVFGGHVVKIHWNDRQGKPFAEEERRLLAFRQPEDQLLIEFSTTLRVAGGPVDLDGDRQHAGVQFRAAQEVAEKKNARFLRPARWSRLPPDQQVNTAEHRELPWNAMQFRLGERAYTVAYLSHPENPGEADFSERLYGRFGEFFRWKLRADQPLRARYRFWIRAGATVTRDEIEAKYRDLAAPPPVKVAGK